VSFFAVKGREFNLHHGLVFAVHDETTGVVRSTQQFRFSSEAQANGIQNGRLLFHYSHNHVSEITGRVSK
jgi:hypothetical protein